MIFFRNDEFEKELNADQMFDSRCFENGLIMKRLWIWWSSSLWFWKYTWYCLSILSFWKIDFNGRLFD